MPLNVLCIVNSSTNIMELLFEQNFVTFTFFLAFYVFIIDGFTTFLTAFSSY